MTSSEYENMLGRLYGKLPKTGQMKRRFEIPAVQHAIMGSRTFIKNFKQICATINRDHQHLLKFMAKSLATSGGIEGEQAVFHGKFKANLIQRILDDYVKEYVICPVCRSPDTNITREERLRFLVCEACGAKSSVR